MWLLLKLTKQQTHLKHTFKCNHLEVTNQMNQSLYSLTYPVNSYEPIKAALKSLIHHPDLFKEIQELQTLSDNESLSKTLVTMITRDQTYGSDSLKNLCELSLDAQKMIRNKALRKLESRNNAITGDLASAFTVFNACKDTEQGREFALKFLVFQIHYLINPNYIRVLNQIYKLRAANSKLNQIEDALTIQQNNTEIKKLLDQNQYKAEDFIILYVYYITLLDYVRATQQKCYNLQKDGKKKYSISTTVINHLENELQKAFQFNQSFDYGIDSVNKVTIEERPLPPLSSDTHKQIRTEGTTAWFLKSYCYYTNIIYKQGIKRSALYDGRYYHIDNKTISDLQLAIQQANQTEYTAKDTCCLSDKALEHLRNMANGTEKNKAHVDYIPLNNGILKLDRCDPEKSVLLGFTPDIVTVIPIQANYIENFSEATEEYKKIDYYFDYISGRFDENYKEYYQEIKNRIIESLSTVITRSQEFKKFFYLHGVADSGKTSLIEIMLASLFDKNLYYSSKNLDELDRGKHNFEMATLENKALLLIDEGGKENTSMRSISQINLDNVSISLKQIVGGSRLDGSEKNKQDKKALYPECRVFITSNNYINLEDKATLEKMVYIPLNIKVNAAELKDIFPDISIQKIKDVFFNYLLRNGLYKVYRNYTEHGYYFTPSKFIDGIQQSAKQATTLYKSVIDFIDEENISDKLPCLNNECYSASNKERFTLKYWRELYKSGDWTKLSDNHFNNVFCELLGVRSLPRQRINGKQCTVVLPKEFPTYGAYQRYCDEQAYILTKTISENTDLHLKEVKANLNQCE